MRWAWWCSRSSRAASRASAVSGDEHLDQVAGQAAQLDAVVAAGEADQQLLCFPDGVGREVVRQVIEDSGDRFGLAG